MFGLRLAILGTRRVLGLKKGSSEVVFHEGWYTTKFSTADQATVKQEIRDSTNL